MKSLPAGVGETVGISVPFVTFLTEGAFESDGTKVPLVKLPPVEGVF